MQCIVALIVQISVACRSIVSMFHVSSCLFFTFSSVLLSPLFYTVQQAFSKLHVDDSLFCRWRLQTPSWPRSCRIYLYDLRLCVLPSELPIAVLITFFGLLLLQVSWLEGLSLVYCISIIGWVSHSSFRAALVAALKSTCPLLMLLVFFWWTLIRSLRASSKSRLGKRELGMRFGRVSEGLQRGWRWEGKPSNICWKAGYALVPARPYAWGPTSIT